MSVGIIMLVHTAFDRAEQVARHWAAAGCPLVIHADRNVPSATYRKFVAALSDLDLGTWVALLFIAAMLATGLSFATFLVETRLATAAIRVSEEVLFHEDQRD